MLDIILAKGWLPDKILRSGIRKRLKNKLKQEEALFKKLGAKKDQILIDELQNSPIAIATGTANEQHYEVPSDFYQLVLGPYLKYSCGYWNKDLMSLEQSEVDMLKLYIERAQIVEAESVLDLGCGWGSFSLFAAQKFPEKEFTAVSNSSSQGAFIKTRAKELGLKNLEVITADINHFIPETKFDRIVSIEMFEHMRNYNKLFNHISSWLTTKGLLFIHIFTHQKYTYKFEVLDDSDWMSKYFFTGGMMPGEKFLLHFSEDFNLLEMWNINGIHYSKTLEAWLEKMDKQASEVNDLFLKTYGNESTKFFNYWRIFFLACSETFKMNGGNEWKVNHYLFQKKS